jgi:hypothetical protein
MNKENQLDVIESLQKAVEQMKVDDIEQLPESAFEMFQCECCGNSKMMAGSIIYNTYRLCNDCVLIAEISFALNKIDTIDELVDSMEEKRLENICNSLIEDGNNNKN